MGEKVPSPCIDVCKFKREGHCIGCSMTEKDKKRFKKLDGKKEKKRFVVELVERQLRMGRYKHWLPAYQRKCRKKGIDCFV